MNKFILGSVVLVLGAALGWYAFKANSPQSVSVASPTPTVGVIEQTATITVKFTDSGFMPANLSVKAGTKVRFTNESGGDMWVASNPHPTHTLLPGFDELMSVAKGNFYEYQFIKVGTWGYHNHLNPSSTGKIIVTP